MAWNEPGNNGKNNDPWKQGGRDQGPPDLDEVFRNLGKKFGGIFGGKGGNSSGGGGSALLMVVLLVALAVWGLSGFYTIKDAERGVILRFGQYHGEVGAGIHWKPTFIDSVTPVNTQEVRSLRADGFMLTQDQNLVRVTSKYSIVFLMPDNICSQSLMLTAVYVKRQMLPYVLSLVIPLWMTS
ncbi:Modulator of FtsH protease HflK [Alishewanella longhuensis]